MKLLSRLNNQAGFTLIQAVFVLVVMALLGVAMMRLIGVQATTSSMALQGARGYQAARSGLEWGAAQASSGNCSASVPMVIEGFNVAVSCNHQTFTEGTIGPYDVYRINAVAEYGSDHRSPDYIQRRLEMKVGFP